MRTLGNLAWLLLGGLFLSFFWYLVGALWCITLVGIPVGLQCFKFGRLILWPFGHEVVFGKDTMSLLLNILWLIFGGLELAMAAAGWGILCCVTVVGIPFGLQHFKFAKLALLPFGARIR